MTGSPPCPLSAKLFAVGYFDEITRFFKRREFVVDPEQFGDPLALQAEWTPLESRGSNVRTHQLVEVNRHRLEFRPSTYFRVLMLIFGGVGLALAVGCLVAYARNGDPTPLVGTLVGLGFGAIAWFIFRHAGNPFVFDKVTGRGWKGRRSPDQLASFERNKVVDLDSIHALQLIREFLRGQESSFHSYELNLILKDGRRRNVVDHGDIKRLRADAERLGDFLGVPVWDGSDPEEMVTSD